jgi:hypothetical protein
MNLGNLRTAALAIMVAGVAVRLGTGSAAAAGSGGAAAFEQMKALVGDWQTDTAANGKATLHLELTAGGTALLERVHTEEAASRWK